MTKRIEIGDIFEIKTPAGLAYIQYTHYAGNMGELVRVLPGLFRCRPQDFLALSKEKELYFVFYTLTYALRNHEIERVSHEPVPGRAQQRPLMRWPGSRDDRGSVIAWKIFEACLPLTPELHQRTPIIRSLSQEQMKLSLHQLWPHPIMVKQLARGWMPERAEEFRLQDVAEAEKSHEERASEPIKHVKR